MRGTIILFVALLLLNSCKVESLRGSKKLIEKELAYTGFNAIAVHNLFKINIVQSDEYKVVLKCNENVEAFVEVKQTGEELSFSLKGNRVYKNLTCIATVYMPDIVNIESSGAAKINIADFKTNELTIESSGATHLLGNLEVERLTIASSGATELDLTGYVAEGEIVVSGASKMNCEDLTFDVLSLESSGASKAVMHVEKEFSVDLSGASKVSYYGRPQIVKEEISGAGKLNHLK
ncbi:MAG: DUF2807 domain-containing protein [Flavobacteriales bacterium]|jgi:acyl carrier protein|nr:DUF2807 domain-containing protein [Flavobacteriales bacterium]